MSEIAPPLPQEKFEFAQPFRFVFDDPQWLPKIAIGGLFYLAGFLIIGWFFLLGYFAQLTRNVIARHPRPLPEWQDLGAMFGEGAKLLVVAVIYSLPNIIVAVIGIALAIMGGFIEPESPLPALMVGCFILLLMPLILVIYLFLPAALVRVAATGEMSSAFEFRELWAFVRRNATNYFLAIVIYIIANAAGQLGVALLCVGALFTMFWSWVVAAYAFAEVYRLDHGTHLQ